MDASPSEDARLWSEMAPQLDEALNQLGDEDREVLLLRFFAQKRMREVGETLGVSEDAAKMRVRRALERLRGQLALRGVTCTVGLLAAFMAERAIQAAPGHLLPRLVALKFASAGGTGLAALLPGAKVGTALTVLLVAGVCLVALLSSPGDASRHSGTETVARAPLVSAAPTSRRLPARHTTPLSFHAADFRPDNVRLRLHVVDAETGAGLANAGSLQPIFTRVELESHTTLLRTRVAPWPFRNRTRAAITA